MQFRADWTQFHCAAFRIRGIDIPHTDERVIALDVVPSPFGTDKTLRLSGQKIVRARDLTRSYQYFNVECYASGTGVYEYRCTVFRDAAALKGARTGLINV